MSVLKSSNFRSNILVTFSFNFRKYLGASFQDLSNKNLDISNFRNSFNFTVNFPNYSDQIKSKSKSYIFASDLFEHSWPHGPKASPTSPFCGEYWTPLCKWNWNILCHIFKTPFSKFIRTKELFLSFLLKFPKWVAIVRCLSSKLIQETQFVDSPLIDFLIRTNKNSNLDT